MKQVKVDSEIKKIKEMESTDVFNYIQQHDEYKAAMAKVVIAKAYMLKEDKYKEIVLHPELMMHKNRDYNLGKKDPDITLVGMIINWHYYLTETVANIGDVVKYGKLYYEVKKVITFDSEVGDVPINQISIYKYCPAYVLEEIPFRSVLTTIPVCACTIEEGESKPLDVIETLRLISISATVGTSVDTGIPVPDPLQLSSDFEKVSLYDQFYSPRAEMSRTIAIARKLFQDLGR